MILETILCVNNMIQYNIKRVSEIEDFVIRELILFVNQYGTIFHSPMIYITINKYYKIRFILFIQKLIIKLISSFL